MNESKKIEIPVINKGQKYSRLVNSTIAIYQESREKKEEILFSGALYYKMKPKDRFVEKKEFILSMEPYEISLDFETEKDKFFYDNQKVPQKLENIDKSINKLIEKLDNK